ncbi:MAG TPA: prolyl oligopeptidase family serine peptidase [Caulobacteraceae bacterium]|nr:prolyl oligopeptidase family serine peptidase [Caulobacteraceae bacterium]
MTPSTTTTPAASDIASSDDPYLWLEDVHGEKALAWVERENARSLPRLKGDPRYETLHQEALTIVNAADRIPSPDLIGHAVFNFWQDPANVRGVWRRTSPESYATTAPAWETVIDLDKLSADEKANWVWGGANCPPPYDKRCLVYLSDGGEDAKTVREFDLDAKSFVDGGFVLPKSKQDVDWLDDDTLILSRDWGPGTMTASSYPFIVKTLKRGQGLDRAVEVFRGKPDDVSVGPAVLHDGDGDRVVLIVRATDFFHSETYQLTDKGMARLDLPSKVNLHGLLAGRLVFTTLEDWRGYKAGDLLAYRPGELADQAKTPPAPSPEHLVFSPGPRQSVEQVAVTAHRLIAAIYDNVRGSLVVFTPGAAAWSSVSLPTAANSSVGVDTASEVDDRVYYAVENFLEPTHLWQADAAAGTRALVKRLPARFDASRDEVEQFEAASSDGTRIPYFVVHPKGMKLDGSNPTILYAYGGFQVSMLPSYSGAIGKLWLERGGVWVLANIRGGGEFGPAWHEAGLKTHRQLVYDDFAAVAKDLIARKITSPRRLGIQGGSNGGLLMGVEFIQHPELWRAVDIEVPLLDMIRIEKIGAGASWVGEYGSPGVPAERAFWEKTSPYQNLKAGVAYPEPFFVTATSDDRVTPVHARKMAAKMQAMGLPFQFFENTNGGHSASANLQERAERVALEFTYFLQKLMD